MLDDYLCLNYIKSTRGSLEQILLVFYITAFDMNI